MRAAWSGSGPQELLTKSTMCKPQEAEAPPLAPRKEVYCTFCVDIICATVVHADHVAGDLQGLDHCNLHRSQF